MSVTLYTKPHCQKCVSTKRALDKKNIPYDTVDIEHDADALARLKALGHLEAPVVETETESWAGFRPDKIEELALSLASA